MTNNETILRQNAADLQTQVAFSNKAIKEMYALWGPIFQWGLLQAECKFGNNVQEFVLRKLKSLGAIEDQLELANALNADLQAQLTAANVRQAELVAELTQLRAAKAAALEQKPVVQVVSRKAGGRIEGVIRRNAIAPEVDSFLYAKPVPTPATVPDEWREVLQECADDLAIELDMRYQSRHQYTSEQRRYDNEMQLVLRARALLQSTKEKK